MRLRKSYIGLIVLAALFGLLGLYNYVIQPMLLEKFIRGAEQPPEVISAEAARTEQRIAAITAVGSVQAINGVDVAAEVGGVVRDIAFASGQAVAKGAVILRLDTTSEEADIRLYQATLKNAQQNLDRAVSLVGKGFVSQANVDNAIAARDQAQAQLQRARADLQKKVIRAPFAGRLGIRQVDLGQYVSPGTAIVTLQAVDPIYVTFFVPEQKLRALRGGQKIEARTDAAPGRVFGGTITSIDARIDEATRNIRVQATLPNPDGALTPGMFVNVAAIGQSVESVVTVPETAISYSLYGDSVFVLTPLANQMSEKPAGQIHAVERRTVTPGEVEGGRVAIVSGLRAGELVATAGLIKLRDGGKAVISNRIPLTPTPDKLPNY